MNTRLKYVAHVRWVQPLLVYRMTALYLAVAVIIFVILSTTD